MPSFRDLVTEVAADLAMAASLSIGETIPWRLNGREVTPLDSSLPSVQRLGVKLHGRGPVAEADAARRLPHVSRRAAGGVTP